MGWFSKDKKEKEPKSAQDLLKKLNISPGLIPTLINPKTKKLDRNEVEGLLPKKEKEKIFKEFDKHKTPEGKLKFGKKYSPNGSSRKSKYTA